MTDPVRRAAVFARSDDRQFAHAKDSVAELVKQARQLSTTHGVGITGAWPILCDQLREAMAGADDGHERAAELLAMAVIGLALCPESNGQPWPGEY